MKDKLVVSSALARLQQPISAVWVNGKGFKPRRGCQHSTYKRCLMLVAGRVERGTFFLILPAEDFGVSGESGILLPLLRCPLDLLLVEPGVTVDVCLGVTVATGMDFFFFLTFDFSLFLSFERLA